MKGNSVEHQIVRLLVATLHVGMTRFLDGGYTQLAHFNGTIFAGQKIIHSPVARVVYGR